MSAFDSWPRSRRETPPTPDIVPTRDDAFRQDVIAVLGSGEWVTEHDLILAPLGTDDEEADRG